MHETVREFEEPVADEAGVSFAVQVRGTERRDHKWEGRLVFAPIGGGDELVTQRESLQSDLNDLTYWAQGLTPAFLESSLARLRANHWASDATVHNTRELVVSTVDDRIAELMGTYALTPGVTRALPGGCRIRYEDTSYTDSDRRSYRFAIAAGSDVRACAAFLCARLSGARLHLDGESVVIDEDSLSRALAPGVSA